ncbi:ABC transporter permease [Aquamicrobium lusatiense]|jgi:peptide/nickel transport system permease protein|uniref:ABC transporter permease n=2 Tax=Aquamicrobium TaxID=69278 RepID=UPI0024561497|nr:ABC transporter permease [Aquamicrobium lusatiense]MDH4991227.1 ABC transporter permease [Aquamicrobium lusatiense]
MIAFLLRRLVSAVPVMLITAFLSFAAFRFIGDPLQNMLGQDATAQDRARLAAELGFDQPFYIQFWRFIVSILHGDFGVSTRVGRPVLDLIVERLPATLELAVLSFILAMAAGIALGVMTALRPRSIFSRISMTGSLIAVSLPNFLISIALIYVFSVQLGWLPAFGRGETVKIGWWTTGLLTASGWQAIILPAISLATFQLTLILRLVRTEMLEVMHSDYIRFARARGLPQRLIYFSYALKNTMVPVVTVAGLQLGSIIAFAVVTETVFQWPGVGLLFINSVNFSDVPIMATYLLLTSLIFVTINMVVDCIYYLIDPRLRAAGAIQ